MNERFETGRVDHSWSRNDPRWSEPVPPSVVMDDPRDAPCDHRSLRWPGILGTLCVAAIATLIGLGGHNWLLRGDSPSSTPTATEKEPPIPVLVTTDGSFGIGEPGDRVLLGDWSCDGLVTPAVYRPTTGEVFFFDPPRDPATPQPSSPAVATGLRHAVTEIVLDPDGCALLAIGPRLVRPGGQLRSQEERSLGVENR